MLISENILKLVSDFAETEVAKSDYQTEVKRKSYL